MAGRHRIRRLFSRRDFLKYVSVTLGASLIIPARKIKSAELNEYWWHKFMPFIETDDASWFRLSQARMVMHGMGRDPTWGPFGQHFSELENEDAFSRVKALGPRIITWIEGFGHCNLYAVVLKQRPDGSFDPFWADPQMANIYRYHWNWIPTTPEMKSANAYRWVGIHNSVNEEDFAMPAFGRKTRQIPEPTYPDGRSAIGWLPEDSAPYPLNARVYDACGAKDINGYLHPEFEPTAGVNEMDLSTRERRGLTRGLFPAIVGYDAVEALSGLGPGDIVYCGSMGIQKDLSAPFWREYARVSVRQILRLGLDGVWCDNYSPWDNFGFPPIQKAFGDWSVYRFHEYLRTKISAEQLAELGLEDKENFDVRTYLKEKAHTFGAADPSELHNPAWADLRWLDDPIWNAFKAFRQKSAQEDLEAFYLAIHDEANLAGRPDFYIGGNDIPDFGLGWVQDRWLDSVNTELTPGWKMGSGSRGIMIPPLGKMAIMYRLALEHQKGPLTSAWYYLDGEYSEYQENPEIAKVLMAEAFANGAFLQCDPIDREIAGSVESHAWWNRFILDHEDVFGRRVPLSEVGVLFSPDNQLASLAPGGFPDFDRQPHVFGHHGWATALVDAHIPYRSIPDWKLTEKIIAPLRVLIVPDAECMEISVASILDNWVRRGGRLVVTGASGMRAGPAESFRKRARSLLENLVGADLSAVGTPGAEREVGDGRVLWTSSPLGMNYYLATIGRAAMLPSLTTRIGSSTLMESTGVPSKVGIFLWKSDDEETMFADLVNYDLDARADEVRPTEGVSFQLTLPAGWESVRSETLSPDGTPNAVSSVGDGAVRIVLPRLEHYVSVVLHRASSL